MSDWWDAAPLADSKSGETVTGKKGDYTFSVPNKPPAEEAPADGEWWKSAPLAKTEQPQREVDIAARPVVGAIKGTANILGAPVDAATWVLNKAGQAATGEKDFIKNPIGGSESIKAALGAIPGGGGNVNNVRPAETTPEKALEAAGEGAAGMVIPGLGAEAVLARSMKETESFGNIALNILKGGGATSNTVLGAAGGIGGEVAADAAPDWLKPTARLIGGILGGVGGAVAETGVRSAGRAVGSVAGDVVRAATEAPEMRAARTILGRSEDPAAFRKNVADAAEAEPLVAGSEPTTFQATGDLGVGGLERDVAAKNNENAAKFAARRTDQNTARLKELDTLADPAADPMAVTDFAKSGHQALTDYHAAQVATATARQEAQTAAHLEALGRLSDPAADSGAVTDYVRTRLQGITDDHAARVATAAQGVADRLSQAGGAAFDNPSAYGDALRAPLAVINQQAKRAEKGLWDAVDPDRSAPINIRPLKQSFDELEKSIPETAKPPSGEEASIISAVKAIGGNQGDMTDFGNIIALRSRLTDAIRSERQIGTPTVERRLTIMLGNVDDALAGAAGEIAADPARRAGIVSNLQREAATWEAQNAQRVGVEARGGAGLGDEGLATGQASGVPAASGGAGETGGTPGVPAGGAGIPEGTGIPADVAERYGAARDATRERKTITGSGPVGAVLRPGEQYGTFRLTAANVARHLFDTPERLNAFIRAAGDNPAALEPMQDYAAFSLRQAAVKDGMLSPERYQKWVADHAYVLRQFPELQARFANVRAAQSTLDETLGAQKAALADYQTGTLRKLIDGEDPIRVAGGALSNSTQFGALVNQVKGDPVALAGLKRATMDYMVGKALSTAGGTPQINVNALQKSYFQNRKTLSGLFSKDELDNMERVTVEMRRASNDATSVVKTALGAQKEALNDYQTGVLKRFLQGEDPAKAAGAALNNPERFKALVAEVAKDPEAFSGLKRAMSDFIGAKAKGTAEAGTSELPQINAATLQKFYLQNRKTLLDSGLFTRDQMDSLERVTTDLQRANRSIVAVKIPGGSNTAQDTGSRAMTALKYMVQNAGKIVGAAVGGGASGGVAGAGLGALGGAAVDAMVAARMASIDKATVELMLHPKVAAEWIRKIPVAPGRDAGEEFARRMRALTANQVMQAIDEENRK